MTRARYDIFQRVENSSELELSPTGKIVMKQGRWLIALKQAMREIERAQSLEAAKALATAALVAASDGAP